LARTNSTSLMFAPKYCTWK